MKRDVLENLNSARKQKRPVVLVTNLESGLQGLRYADGHIAGEPVPGDIRQTVDMVLREDRCQTMETPAGRYFFQVYNPPLRMFIIGAVHIAQALAPMAAQCGYEVTIIDPRTAFASDARFPGICLVGDWPGQALAGNPPDCRTAVITLAHDPKLDDPALEIALTSDAFYIGALGSRKTQAARHDRLLAKGFTEDDQSRIHGPIGMDIGGRSPAEVAVSIMAEVTQCLRSGQRK